ncbi:hypothetical protein [Pseudoroseomonas cervicalis]|uniref:hypothetical protein n=1 Tax=Teichococcus cervicalis TaxID=204525 RepID=UPI0022F1BA93|nr:hypothetical protein [Pseudoroseomonas cervicalis]WBV42973.1 hypothetical protein PFY06_17340 [Pseudoroseomonas cervicalis]
MARIPVTLAAAALALSAGVAQAQMTTTQSTMPQTGMGNPASAGTSQAAPMPAGSMPMAAPRPHAAPGHHGMQQGGAMPGVAGSASTYGMSGMTPGASGAAPMGGANVVPTPAQPFAGVTLPQQGVGDGAYNGGGVVLEYLPDGTTRVVR